MKQSISIHDYENSRVILSTIPAWLIKACNEANIEDIGAVVIEALGLSNSSTEYMVMNGDIELVQTELDNITADFMVDCTEAIENHKG